MGIEMAKSACSAAGRPADLDSPDLGSTDLDSTDLVSPTPGGGLANPCPRPGYRSARLAILDPIKTNEKSTNLLGEGTPDKPSKNA